MSYRLVPYRKPIDVTKPTFEFWEDGDDWMVIKVQGKPDRYMKSSLAQVLIRQIFEHSRPEKTDLIVPLIQ